MKFSIKTPIVTLLMVVFSLIASGNNDVKAAIIYSNDFTSGSTAGFSGGANVTSSPSGEKFVLLYGGQTATLSLSGLVAGSSLNLKFDIYAIKTVDGDVPAWPNRPFQGDFFAVLAGDAYLWKHTLSNYAGHTQDYPVRGSAPKSGATAVDTLGYQASDSGDATYAVEVNTVVGPSGSVNLTFIGQTDQAVIDEAFGFDNVIATGTRNPSSKDVPEPLSLGLMGAGLVCLGVARRRRREIKRISF